MIRQMDGMKESCLLYTSNSCKDYRKQPAVAASIAEQISDGSDQVVAVMIESLSLIHIFQ